MWDLIVSVPDHCLSFYFTTAVAEEATKPQVLLLMEDRQLIFDTVYLHGFFSAWASR